MQLQVKCYELHPMQTQLHVPSFRLRLDNNYGLQSKVKGRDFQTERYEFMLKLQKYLQLFAIP